MSPFAQAIQRCPLIAFFGLAYAISWVLWAPLWLSALGVAGLPVLPFHHALGSVGPVAAAFVVSYQTAGRDGPRALLAALGAWRGRMKWIGLAVLGPALVLAAAVVVGAWIEGTSVSWEGVGVSKEFPAFSMLGFFVYNVVTFGVGEETGWRGFALPRLQSRHSALVATALLTVGWAAWHLPLFLYRPGYTSMGPGGIAGWLASLFTGAVLLTWLFNASQGSLLVVALFHAAIDVVFTSDVASPVTVTVAGALVTVWGLAVLGLAGPRTLAGRNERISHPMLSTLSAAA